MTFNSTTLRFNVRVMQDPTRLSLIERLQETGDDEAWEEFVDIYGRLVMRWLVANGVQHSDAEDLRQDITAVVLVEIRKFSHNGRAGAFRAWLRRITVNRLHRLWDRKDVSAQRQSDVDLGNLAEQLSDEQSRLSVLWDKEHNQYLLLELLDRIRDRFSDANLSAFTRMAIHGEPAAQVAADMGMTLGAVRVAQHRILRALKQSVASLSSLQ